MSKQGQYFTLPAYIRILCAFQQSESVRECDDPNVMITLHKTKGVALGLTVTCSFQEMINEILYFIEYFGESADSYPEAESIDDFCIEDGGEYQRAVFCGIHLSKDKSVESVDSAFVSELERSILDWDAHHARELAKNNLRVPK